MLDFYDLCGGTDDIFILAGFFWFFAHFCRDYFTLLLCEKEAKGGI